MVCGGSTGVDDDGLTNECWGYDAEEGEWTFVVEMGDAKAQHAGTAFPDGTFLVRGGGELCWEITCNMS